MSAILRGAALVAVIIRLYPAEPMSHDAHVLARIDERLRHLERTTRAILELLLHPSGGVKAAPSAGRLSGIFTPGTPMSSTVLTATVPTSRQDGSTLAPTDIASITYQKTSLTGSPPVAGPNVILQTNSAVAGNGLLPTDLTYTDSTAVVGDSYTCYFTDTLGHIGAVSNAFVNPQILSPPAAGTLTGVFTQ